MNELEALKQKKKEIEKQIRILEYEGSKFNRAAIKKDVYSGYRNDEWKVIYKVNNRCLKDEKTDRYITIANANTKEECLVNLMTVIADLQGLLEKMEDEE